MQHLREICEKGRIVSVGGLRVPAHEKSIKEVAGCAIDHVESYRNNTAGIDALVRQLRKGRVSLLVLLEGLMGHQQYNELVAAARASGTPVVYAGKGGIGEMRRALAEADQRLGAARRNPRRVRRNPAPEAPLREDYAIDGGAFLPQNELHRLTWHGGIPEATMDYTPDEGLVSILIGQAVVMKSGPFKGHHVVWRGTYVEVPVVDGEALPDSHDLRKMGIAGATLFFPMWERMKELVDGRR